MKNLNIKLEVLSEHFAEPVKVVMRAEYPTLMIGKREITQGGVEVEQRIDQLIRENALDYDVSDKIENGAEQTEDYL